jgi:thiol-disulfide isomerase/thioredoxin
MLVQKSLKKRLHPCIFDLYLSLNMRTLAAFIFAWICSFNVHAQLPSGSIAPDFTVTDINGNTHHLYDYLDQGYTVVLEFTATWCGPCWNYTSSGALADLYSNYGADFGGNVIVLFIEADGFTSTDQIFGSSGSQGNWSTIVPYPIVSLPALNGYETEVGNLYELTYFPTVYSICPNGVITETGQITSLEHANIIQDQACQGVYDVDAYLSNYAGSNATCAEINIGFDLINLGNLPLTSGQITVTGVEPSINTNWNGYLGQLESTYIDLGNAIVVGPVEILFSNPGEQNATNNVLVSDVTLPLFETSNLLQVQLDSDCWPEETSWNVQDALGNVVYSSAPYPNTNQEPIVDIVNLALPSAGCYFFTIFDGYGDGMFGSQSNCPIDGAVHFNALNSNLIATGNLYTFLGSQQFTSFTIPFVVTETTVFDYNVTLNVDMNNQVVSPNGVHLAGAFQGWNPGDPNYELFDLDGDGIYTIQFNAPIGEYEYKFVNGNSWLEINESIPMECSVNGNRFLVVDGSIVNETYCFNECTAQCGGGTEEPTGNCSDIFISEYVEGSSNNKAIELYNPTPNPIDLAAGNYSMGRELNGSGVPMLLPLTGIVPAYGTRVFVLDKRDPNGIGNEVPVWVDLQAVADTFVNPIYVQSNSPFYFNGDDAFVLVKEGTTVLDIIGKVGEDPGLGWYDPNDPTMTSLTHDRTLVRKSTIGQGVSVNPDVFNPLLEWEIYEVNDFSHLGWHASWCQGAVAAGCTNSEACNYNVTATVDDGSCLMVGVSCDDGNANTYDDVITENCACSGSAFSYGSLNTGYYLICGDNSEGINLNFNQSPFGISEYNLQWYYRDGIQSAPTGGSTLGWTLIPGATSPSYTTEIFSGSRTFACYLMPFAGVGLPAQWANNAVYFEIANFSAQSIIGNPNITPFTNYVYVVNPVVGNSYNWTTTNGGIISGQGSNTVTVMWGQNGPYQITLTESNGDCSDESTLFVVNNSCSISVAAVSADGNTFCPGTTASIQAVTAASGVTYQWYLNGAALSGATNIDLNIASGGNYQVMITQGACTAISQTLAVTELPAVVIPNLILNQSNPGCSGGSATITAEGGSFSSYLWSNGANTASIEVTASGDYTVELSDENGCVTMAGPVSVNFALQEAVPLCLVTVDPTTGHNVIVWEPVTSEVTNAYVVYKETNVADVYEPIGTVPYGSDGIFEDVNSNSAVQASRYKLALIDTCDIESSLSDLHKTIHLTSNLGVGNTVNLIWSHYEGFAFGSYTIYRGTTPDDMAVLATIASNLNSYTDLLPLTNGYYMIEVEGVSCDPSRSVQTSKSNIINYEFVGVDEQMASQIKIYPNPATDRLTLQCAGGMRGATYDMYDATGRVVLTGPVTATTMDIDVSLLQAGLYVVRVNQSTLHWVKH